MTGAQKNRLSAIDLLRFTAALAVVIYHTYLQSQARAVTQFGFMGVHIFFMISGFVILWTASKKDVYEFLASRVSRLYPSFWICVLLTYLALRFTGAEVSGKTLLANLLMIPSAFHEPFLDSVYWTLRLELQFYALIMLLLLTRQLVRIEAWLWAWLGLCIVGSFVNISGHLTLDSYAPLFIAGCFLYLVFRDGASLVRLAALATCFITGARFLVQTQTGFTQSTALYVQCTTVAILLAAFVAFFLIVTRRLALPQSPIWYWLGGMTYPLYLIHYEAAYAITKFLPHVWWHQLIRILVALAISAILAAYSERKLCPLFDKALLHARCKVQPGRRVLEKLLPPGSGSAKLGERHGEDNRA